MTDPDLIQLKNCDSLDISDVLIKVEKSLDFKFGKDDLKTTKTFGELCDIILSKVTQEHVDDSTTQQVFYKLRQAVVQIQSLEENTITPHSDLGSLFPSRHRRANVSQIARATGIPINILRPKKWISTILLWAFLASIIEIFIHWKYGLFFCGLTLIAFKVANWLGKEFTVQTMGELPI